MVQTIPSCVDLCVLCDKKIQKRQKSTVCQCCKKTSHFKCNKLNHNYTSEIFMCLNCNQNNLPFYDDKSNTHENHFGKEFIASETLKTFFKDMNEFETDMDSSNDSNIDVTPIINCKYVDIVSLKSLKKDKKSFSLIHLNIHSLEKNKDELATLLSTLEFKFDAIGISETKLKTNTVPKYDISLEGYKHFSTPSEANKGGVILYILDKHISSSCNSLNKLMYKSRVLESIFVEIEIPNKKNIIIACIYRHPSMDLKTFNEEYFMPLLNKIKKNKHIFLMGDFNVNLMKTDDDNLTTEFFDILTSNHFVPHIIHPTRITPHSKTLIDNIFSNIPNFSQGLSGNLTIALSDHLAQFLIIPLDSYFKPPKIEKYKRDLRKFDRENFLLDLLEIDWSNKLELNKNNPDLSFQQYYQTINELVDKYIPLTKMTNKEVRLQSKPWIDNQILNRINERDRLYNKFLKSKNENVKKEYERRYKEARNNVTTELNLSKKDTSTISSIITLITSRIHGVGSNQLFQLMIARRNN